VPSKHTLTREAMRKQTTRGGRRPPPDPLDKVLPPTAALSAAARAWAPWLRRLLRDSERAEGGAAAEANAAPPKRAGVRSGL
jgi:hypothetical protein